MEASIPRQPGRRPDLRNLSEAVVTLARLVIAGEDPDRLTREAVRAVATALHADRCEILRPALGGDRLLCVASCGEGALQGCRDAIPCGVSSAAGYALLCRAPVVSENLKDERRFGAAGAPRLEGPVSALAAPVAWHGGDYGVLVAYAGRADAFDARHALSVGRVASLLGGALECLEEREELRRRAEEAERRLEAVVGLPEGSPEREVHGLTDRQLEVLGLMADGRSAKQMASELGLSIHTIHSHQRNLYRALGVGSLAGALKRAAELGLLPPPSMNPEDR